MSQAICRSPEMAAMLMPVFGIQITLGEIRKMVDEAEKWIESRKMHYVGDFWNVLKQDDPKNILAKLDSRFHDENVSIDDKIYLLSSASAMRFNEILQSWYDALYKRPDIIDFKQADNIFTVGRGDLNNGAVGHDASHNIGTIVSTGLGSAMTFAWRSLQVVGKIAPGSDKDAKILGDVFEKSQDHLLARLSTETHTFISLLQFFIQQP